MNVYTYYMPVPGLWSEDSQRALIDVWARSWKKQGWNPVVLNEEDAKKHPRYAEFKKKYWSLPTEYGHDYEGACFLRYVAVAAAGGGMMTDYDVINYGVPPSEADPTKMIFYSDQSAGQPESTGCTLAPQSLYEGLCQLFFEWVPDKRDWNPNSKPPGLHCSDLTFVNQMFAGLRPKPEWAQVRPGCAIFPEVTWKTSPMVHYCYAMHAAGYWPKHEHIEKIRPF